MLSLFNESISPVIHHHDVTFIEPIQAVSPIRVALIGCGAISELFYTPALKALAEKEALRVVALVDPDHRRLVKMGAAFPGAKCLSDVAEIAQGEAELAIVASPQKFHCRQSIELLQKGLHVLCEKPMAATSVEGQAMAKAAAESNRLLAVGLFRRFFPSSGYIRDLIREEPLGKPLDYEWKEGGAFDWPSASPSFFDRKESSGGVFAHLGAHVVDLLLFWFGEYSEFQYEDDAMGGLEANARLHLSFTNGVQGSVRLSRDTKIANGIRIRFERGSVWMPRASADSVMIQFERCGLVAESILRALPADGRVEGMDSVKPCLTYTQSFMAQITNLCCAIRGQGALRVPAAEALVGMELIEKCYSCRRIMPMPWLDDKEMDGGLRASMQSS